MSNGSVIHVYPNQFMMLVDGGKVVDYTAEEGYYTIDHSAMPSMFNGQFGEALKESFNRIRFGGITPTAQKVYYVNPVSSTHLLQKSSPEQWLNPSSRMPMPFIPAMVFPIRSGPAFTRWVPPMTARMGWLNRSLTASSILRLSLIHL